MGSTTVYSSKCALYSTKPPTAFSQGSFDFDQKTICQKSCLMNGNKVLVVLWMTAKYACVAGAVVPV